MEVDVQTAEKNDIVVHAKINRQEVREILKIPNLCFEVILHYQHSSPPQSSDQTLPVLDPSQSSEWSHTFLGHSGQTQQRKRKDSVKVLTCRAAVEAGVVRHSVV